MQLIVAEKPKVAKKIASFLSNKFVTKRRGKAIYFEFENEGKKVVVASAVGHLFVLSEKNGKSDYLSYPVFDVEWKEVYKINKKLFHTKDYIENLKSLGTEADQLVIATDYDTEGSLIGYNIFRWCFNKKEVKRMKFSAITPKDIREAYSNLNDLDYLNAYAGEVRHIIDWYYGINLSRALMSSLKKQNINRVMSIGRVQGPALAILAKRELEIKNFVPTPYWEIKVYVGNTVFEFKEGKIENEIKAKEIFNSIPTKGKILKVNRIEKKVYPYPPFDLTSLQLEAYKHFRFSPSYVLKLSQNLYEDSYISYPRTSSQKLPYSLNLPSLIEKISKIDEYREKAQKLIDNKMFTPFQGNKTDPAHPAIHPTGIYGEMGKDEKKLYDLIVYRFLSVFAQPAIKRVTDVEALFGNSLFTASGEEIIEKGWIEIYEKYFKEKDKKIDNFEEGDEVEVKSKKLEEKTTKPPKRYTPASLIAELEEKKLGTKTTRAIVVDTLYERNYIKGKSIKVTDFGLAVYETLKKYSATILDENLTRKLEEDMEKVQNGEIEMNEVINEGKGIVIKILEEFKENEDKIGKDLKLALEKTENEEKYLGKCPHCGGDLIIKNVKESRFVGCSNYPKCTAIYPLPRKGLIIKTDKICKFDNLPIISIMKGKKSLEKCLSPTCTTNKIKGEKNAREERKSTRKEKKVKSKKL